MRWLLITVFASFVEGVYRGLQDRFGLKVWQGYKEYQDDRRRNKKA